MTPDTDRAARLPDLWARVTTAQPALSMPGACPHCSGPFRYVTHGGSACPRIKAVEYHPNGAVKRVEFREESR